MPGRPSTPESVGLPRKPFLYTLDQISALLHIKIESLKVSYIWYEGRSTGTPTKHALKANNIAPINEKAEWRVEERELVRWMKVKGFRAYE